MDSTIHWQRAALIGLAALAVGCAPDTGDREGAARPGDSALSRNDSGEPPAANRDSAARAPTTQPTNPAGPGSAAAPPRAAAPGAEPPATPRLTARAEIRPLADNTVRGIVEFQAPAAAEGPMTINVSLMGLDAGPHGMHIHEGMDCSAPGEHLNPQGSPHGPANAAAGMRHLGDLGNITADASGMVEQMLRDSLLSGDTSFIGRVVVVHRGQDDLSTQPDGSAGMPIACGVIEQAGEDQLSQGGSSNRGV